MDEKKKPQEAKTEESGFAKFCTYLKKEHEKSWGNPKDRPPNILQRYVGRKLEEAQRQKEKARRHLKWLKETPHEGKSFRELIEGEDYAEKQKAREEKARKRSQPGYRQPVSEVLLSGLWAGIRWAALYIGVGFFLVLFGIGLSMWPFLCLIGFPTIVVGVFMIFWSVVVFFQAMWRDLTYNPEQVKRELEEAEKSIEEAKIREIKRKMQEQQENERLAELAKEQLEADKRKEEEKELDKLKVDLGDGKKVPLKSLPAPLQKRIREEYRNPGESNEESEEQ